MISSGPGPFMKRKYVNDVKEISRPGPDTTSRVATVSILGVVGSYSTAGGLGWWASLWRC